ncbi:septation protein SpoVG family protein [Oscillibacter sp.]|uniref:septation protein SpoVG family protein n=1 Tax=Oscillibacter sp. TaxID=1945593 RepID=UPI0028AD4003|nr:septation protein SpoVG family protein [Oscillibacter sp.]
MAKTQTAAEIPVVDEAAQEEMHRLLFDAPIAELAGNQGISIDEAVRLRVEQTVAAVTEPQVTVRPIEPKGKLIGFASVNFGGVVVDDFKVVNGKNGVFLGAPSKPAPGSRTGYHATARVTDGALQERLDTAAAAGYSVAVEKLIARAEAVRPTSIKEEMAKAAEGAAKENAARTAPTKGKEARDDR